jgi:hypothetical protein
MLHPSAAEIQRGARGERRMAENDRLDRRLAEIRDLRRGEALLAQGDDEAALACLSAAAALRPAAATWDLVARCQHRLGRLDAALASYRRVTADAARAGRHLYAAERGLLDTLRDAGDWRQADRVADRLSGRIAAAPCVAARALLESDSRYPYHRWRGFFEKDRLAASLAAWRSRHGDAQPFWPESFVLPAEETALARFRATCPADQIFVVKPTSRSGGQGVRVTREPRAGTDPAVVQRYLDRPYLIDGRKCHVRRHLLIAGAAAPRAYLHSEGIVRIAPEPYATDEAALRRSAAHVTNTALHRFHRDMVVTTAADDESGNVRSLTALLRHMAAHGLDAARIAAAMVDLARVLVGIVAESGLFRAQAEEHGRYCFPPLLFGLDLLIDQDGRAWLLECQRAPALHGSALVERIAGDLADSAVRMQLYRLGEAASDAAAREAAAAAQEEAMRGGFEPLF